MRKKTMALVSSCAAIAVCSSIIVGSTYALFTSNSEVDITVKSGKVDVVATVGNLNTEGLLSGGTATLSNENKALTVNNFMPMDSVSFDIKVVNNSTVTVKYRTVLYVSSDDGLFDGLEVTFNGEEANYTGETITSNINSLEAGVSPEDITVTISLPEEAGNEYQEKTCKITYAVEAVQGNGEFANDAMTSVEYNNVKTDAALRKAVEHSIANEGETVINLGGDIALSKEIYLNGAHDITINGNGHKLTPAEGFEKNGSGQWQLVKVQTNAKVVLSNLVLEQAYSAEAAEAQKSYHTLDIWGSENVTLDNLTVKREVNNEADTKGGAPVVITGSNVTVTGTLNVVASGTSWYGINVDSNTTKDGIKHDASLTVADGATILCDYLSSVHKVAAFCENGAEFINNTANTSRFAVNIDGDTTVVTTTNVAIACQASFNELFKNQAANIKEGDVIVLGEGTFNVNEANALKITANNVTLKGAGKDKTIIDCGENHVSGQAGLLVSGDNVTVSDLTVKTSSTNVNVAALKVTKVGVDSTSKLQLVNNVTIKNVAIYGSASHGLNLHGVKVATVDNVDILSYGKCGISVAMATDVVFTNCTTVIDGWKSDIGCMFKANDTAYEDHSEITIGEGNNFANGVIYSERVTNVDDDKDTINYNESEWEFKEGDLGDKEWILIHKA